MDSLPRQRELLNAWAGDVAALEHERDRALARVRDLEGERDTYAEIGKAALDMLHHVTNERNRLRDRLRKLLTALRDRQPAERPRRAA